MRLFLFLLPINLFAQQTPLQVFTALNQHLASIEQGSFEVKNGYKSLHHQDTSWHTATVYFWRNENPKDSIRSFVIRSQSRNTLQAFDGNTYYEVFPTLKIIWTEQVQSSIGASKKLEKSNLRDMAYKPFLFNPERPAYNLSRFEKVRHTRQKDKMVVTVRDSFANPLKIKPEDPKFGYIEWRYSLPLHQPTPELVYITTTIADLTQYSEVHLSPIQILSVKSTLSDYFPLDSFLKAGYQIRAVESAGRPPLPIHIGDTIPNFDLPVIYSNDTLAKAVPNYLILYDFWFKNCAACHLAIPFLNRIQDQFHDKGLQVFGVNGIDRNRQEIEVFIKDRGMTYPTLLDTNRSITKLLKINAFPTLVLIESVSRKVVWVSYGHDASTETALGEVINQYLK